MENSQAKKNPVYAKILIQANMWDTHKTGSDPL